MKKFLFLFISLPLFTFGQVSPENVVNIVQQQLEAYNQRDLAAFVELFHEEAALYNLGESTPIAKGIEQITEIYGRLFQDSPNLRSNVVSRQVIGNKVLDYEIITGRQNQTEPMYLIAIYEIVEGKIHRCFFIRQ